MKNKKIKTFYLDEETISTKIREWIDDVDCDELADIVGRIFGGNCYHMDDEYVFDTDENYSGAFDKL